MAIDKELTCIYDTLEPTYPQVPGNIPIGKTLLILGPSRKGPLLKPLYIRNSQQVVDLFGNDFLHAFQEANSAGASNIFMMRIGELTDPEEAYSVPDKNTLYIYFQEAYELLQGFHVDYILPIGVYFDDSYDLALSGDSITFVGSDGRPLNFAKQLADFCHRKMNIGDHCHGIIGARQSIQDVETWYDHLVSHTLPLNIDGTYNYSFKFMDLDVDCGRYISVVLSFVKVYNTDGTSYYTSGASAYAGLLTSISTLESPTNKKLPVTEIYEVLDKEQMDILANCGFVVFKQTVHRGIVPFEAVTFASPDSNYHAFPNIRILNIACERIKSRIEIGGRLVKTHELDIANGVLEEMVVNNEIKSFTIDSEITSATSMNLLIEINPYTHTSSISTNLHINTS